MNVSGQCIAQKDEDDLIFLVNESNLFKTDIV
jgi:hypothetical protein